MLKTTRNTHTTSEQFKSSSSTGRRRDRLASFFFIFPNIPRNGALLERVVLTGGSQVCRCCNCVRTSAVALQHLLYRLHGYYKKNISGTCRLLKWKT